MVGLDDWAARLAEINKAIAKVAEAVALGSAAFIAYAEEQQRQRRDGDAQE